MSSGLFRSMRRMRPFESARTRTLFATWAATKSAAMENCSWTRSTMNMGNAAASSRSSTPLPAAKPSDGFRAMVVCGRGHTVIVARGRVGKSAGEVARWVCAWNALSGGWVLMPIGRSVAVGWRTPGRMDDIGRELSPRPPPQPGSLSTYRHSLSELTTLPR